MDFFEEPGQGHHGPSHERWLISYADFITLLFAVFVVLFTTATAGKGRAKEVSQAVQQALQAGILTFSNKSTAQGQGTDGRELLPSINELAKQFRKEIERKELEVRMEPRGLVISLRQAAFFASGEADIQPAAYGTVDKIAAVIASVENPVHLEGHTDAIPIATSRFRSNWELSAARSIAMLELLTNRNKLPRERLSISGFADTVPLESNDTEEGRSHNRRVDVVIMKERSAEPAPNAPGSQRVKQ